MIICPQNSYSVRVMKDLPRAADIALKHRLYVSGWELSGTLKYFRKAEYLTLQCCKIALAFHEGTPIGVITVDVCGQVSVFVKKAHRRRAIGSRLLSAIKSRTRQPLIAGPGSPGSSIFWAKNQIQVIEP